MQHRDFLFTATAAVRGLPALPGWMQGGSFILEGNWLFTVLVGVVLFSFVGVLFFNRTRLIAHAHDLKNRRTKRSKGSARKMNRIPLRYRFCKITASPLNKDFTLNLLYCNSPLKNTDRRKD